MTKSEINREISERRNEWIKLETRYSPEFELDSDEIVPKDWTSPENAMVLFEEMRQQHRDTFFVDGERYSKYGIEFKHLLATLHLTDKPTTEAICEHWLKYDDGRTGNEPRTNQTL